MDFLEAREAQQNSEVNEDSVEHLWEKDNVPTIHSGFTTTCLNDPNWNVLFLSLWYANGSYVVRLQDRENKMRAFVEVESLDKLFQVLDLKIKSGRIPWKPEKATFKENRMQ